MSEELDELASAYIDGEATPDEAARVESTPELLDLVDELRAVRASSLESPSPTDETKERHLAAALAAFDELQAARPSHLSVVSSSRSFPEAEQEAEDAPPTDGGEVVAMPSRTRRRMPPAWLVNAAAAVVVVGGVGFAVTQAPSGSDDTAAESVELSEADEEAESFDAASSSDAVTTSGALERADALVGESPSAPNDSGEDTSAASDSAAAEGDAMEDDAMEDDAMEDAASDGDATDEDATEEDADVTEEESADDSADEAQPISPVLSVASGSTASDVLSEFDLQFDDEVLTTPPHRCQDVIDAIVDPSTGSILGYAPVEVGGVLVDLVVVESPGQRGALLVDAECGLLSDE